MPSLRNTLSRSQWRKAAISMQRSEKQIQMHQQRSLEEPFEHSGYRALVWHRNRVHEGKDSSLPLPRSLPGTAKLTEPLSLEAQPKSDAFTTVRYYLYLTKEERTPVFMATKLANPDADAKAFNKAYKIALWKADSLKKGINPGQNWDAVDFSPVSDTYSEDSDQESSTSSEDGMQVIRKDL
jgi:hypothetical protein